MTQIELLRFAIVALERLNVPYALVGSFACGIWGVPRMTRDIDVVVQFQRRQTDEILAAFPDDDFYVSRSAVNEAIRALGQFNVIHPTSGNKIDFMVTGESEWAKALLRRRRRVKLMAECEGYVATAEDVILGKLVYFRDGGSDKHLSDIAGILKRSGNIVDLEYVERMARLLDVFEFWERFAGGGDAAPFGAC